MPANARGSSNVDAGEASEGPTAAVIPVFASMIDLLAAWFEDLFKTACQCELSSDAEQKGNLTLSSGSASSTGAARAAGRMASIAVRAVKAIFMVGGAT